MKYGLSITIGTLLASCGQTTNPIGNVGHADTTRVINAGTNEKERKATTSSLPVRLTDLREKVFKAGRPTDFTDTCAFYFECDCCSGELIFNTDSTFYYADYCVSDKAVRAGEYALTSNLITLNFGEASVRRVYNFENEFDTSAVDYYLRDTVLEAISIRYVPEICDGKIKLVDADLREIAIESNSDYRAAIDLLTEEGFIERLEDIEK